MNEILKKAKEGDMKAKEQIINDHIKMVYKIVSRFYSKSLDNNDLVQEGIIGILESINKFDDKRGMKFSTYVYMIVETKISLAVRKSIGNGVSISQKRYAAKNKFFRELREIEDRLGKKLDKNEIIELMCLTNEEFNYLYNDINYLDVDDESNVFIDDNTKWIDELDNKILVDKILSIVSRKDRRFLTARFGLNNTKKYSNQELAEEFGISENTPLRWEQIIAREVREELST